MRILLLLILFVAHGQVRAYTVDSVLRPWLKQRSSELGLLRNISAATKTVSAFAPQTFTSELASPSDLQAVGMPLSFTGATLAGYQLRGGVIFPYGQAYLLHYQEGEPEDEDHWFRLCKRHDGEGLTTIDEFGTCIGELRRLRISSQGPEFLLLVESGCGSGYTIRLLLADGPQVGPLVLPTWQGDMDLADLDGDGSLELLHKSRKEPPAGIALRLETASDYLPPVVLWLTTAWRWDGKRWVNAGEQWTRSEP